MIEVEELVKHYRAHSREAGVGAALRSVFRRRYDVVVAVDRISFRIAAGERVGFLGPNGAGKTTTIKMLSGLLVPTAGRARVLGFTPSERRRDYLSAMTLVAGQKQQLLWDLPPVDTFELNRAIYGVPRPEARARIDEIVTLLDLGAVVRKPTRQLSMGERMKCELAAALLHRPRVLFLDEPTIGLDVTMQATVRRFIQDYNERYGATVLLTSHNMDDVAQLCERVIIIDHGRLLFDGPLATLVQRVRPEKRLTLTLGQPLEAAALAGFGRVVQHHDTRVVLQVPQAALHGTVQGVLQRLPVVDLTVEAPPLEEILSDLFSRGRPGEPEAR